ncbi:hypothetical protein [Streptomyces bauhiniae]|uniref:hypothetical protein n=1 Tax=Streptomyces bauhiniae TaxID=2340725 RepID=UPI0035DD8770
MSLVHEGHLYKVDSRASRIVDALEPADAVIAERFPSAAVGGWAAVESLLAHTDDWNSDRQHSGKAIAADHPGPPPQPE